MNKSILLPLLLALVLSLACTVSGISFPTGDSITGSGDVVELDQDFSDFDSLEIRSAFDVDVNQGDEFSVVVRIDDNLVDYLDLRQTGDEVKIGLEDRNYNYDAITLEAEVTLPVLSAIDLSGASRAVLDGLSSNSDFLADISGASRLLGEISAGDCRFDVSGAGSADLSGSGSSLDIDASGGSSVDLADFAVGDASVRASGASTVVVNVNGALDVNASSASRVEYLGNPTLGSIELSSAATIEER